MKYLQAIKNNWKKSIFFSGLLGYGAYYLKTYIDINNHMRYVCNEVASNSMQSGPVKHVVVVVNPTANKKKCENFFKKYGEPVLHLAGYSVEILRTNFMGHAKTLIEEMSTLPDAIVIAGGDGTASEVVTGLMRRGQTANCTVAILPLGCKSETAFKYLNITGGHENKFKDVCSVTNCIMGLIKENTKTESIMQFDVIEDGHNSSSTVPKSVYGLNSFSWGLHRDIEAIKDKYWYFGSLRHNAAILLNSFSNNLNWKFSTDFVYTPPCAGCRHCKMDSAIQWQPSTRPYIRGIFSNQTNNTIRPLLENKECAVEIEGKHETSQLSITNKRNESNFNELEAKFLHTLQPGFSFMKNAINLAHSDIRPNLTLNSRTIRIMPNTLPEHGNYSIDGEEYDIRPIKISLLQNAIKVVYNIHGDGKQ